MSDKEVWLIVYQGLLWTIPLDQVEDIKAVVGTCADMADLALREFEKRWGNEYGADDE